MTHQHLHPTEAGGIPLREPVVVVTRVGVRPPTVNKMVRGGSVAGRRGVAGVTRDWREWAGGEAVGQVGPCPLPWPVVVCGWPLHANRRSPQDAGACLPAVKAAIDGLRDAGVLAEDDGQFDAGYNFGGNVAGILLMAPVICGVDGLRVSLHPLASEGDSHG